jgi:hypothetical protein
MSKKIDLYCKACGCRDIRVDALVSGEIVATTLRSIANRKNSAAKGESELLAAYARLHDMLSDMIESGRLREADIPNDYRALVDQLSGPCNAAMAKARGD